MRIKAGDIVALVEQLGGHVVEVLDEYRPGIYQVRLPGCPDFAISNHALQLVAEAEPVFECNERAGLFKCERTAPHKGERHNGRIGASTCTWGYVPKDDEL